MWAGTPNRNIIPATERQDKKQQNKHPTIVCGIIIYNINGITKPIIVNFVTGRIVLYKNACTSKSISRFNKRKWIIILTTHDTSIGM